MYIYSVIFPVFCPQSYSSPGESISARIAAPEQRSVSGALGFFESFRSVDAYGISEILTVCFPPLEDRDDSDQ